MWIPDLYFIVKIRFLVISAILCSNIVTVVKGCGGFIEIGSGATHTISLTSYGPYTNCIWVVEGPGSHKLSNTVNFQGEGSGTSCSDYIEAKDGSLESDVILAENCGTLTDFVFNSTNRWLLVQFRSDGTIHNGSLSVLITPVSESSLSGSNPLKDCKAYHMSCSNKICMPRSYRCDGFNDCGCDDDCDETGCAGLGLETAVWMAIAYSTGFGVFVLIFIFVFIYERRRRNIALQKEREDRMIEEGRKLPEKGGKGKKDDKKDKDKDSKKKVAWHK